MNRGKDLNKEDCDAFIRYRNKFLITSQGLKRQWERDNGKKLEDNSGLEKLSKLAKELGA